MALAVGEFSRTRSCPLMVPFAMTVDVHSHCWRFPDDFSADFIRQAQRARGGQPVDLRVRLEDYAASAPADTRTIVFGGKARLSGVWVDDRLVAD